MRISLCGCDVHSLICRALHAPGRHNGREVRCVSRKLVAMRGVLDTCSRVQHRVGWNGGIIVYLRPHRRLMDDIPCARRPGGVDSSEEQEPKEGGINVRERVRV